jgi:hypothetical protein
LETKMRKKTPPPSSSRRRSAAEGHVKKEADEGRGGVVDSICQINGIVIQNALLCYCLYRT